MHLVRAADASAMGRKPRTEHVGDVHEIGVLADGTRLLGRDAALPGSSNQLGMGVAHIVTSEPPLAELRDHRLAGKPVVDVAGTGATGPLHAVGAKTHGRQASERHWEPRRDGDPTVGRSKPAGSRGVVVPRTIVTGKTACMADPTPSSPPNLDATPAPGSWHRFTAAGPSGRDQTPADGVQYGADLPTEARLRLLGPIEGRRLLDLGCGDGRAAVAFARQGAKVIAVDSSVDRLGEARRLAEQQGVRIELHHADLAALAFLHADGVDAVFSAFALAEVADLSRVFRQVHRVLKPEAPLVFSLPHPAFTMLDPRATDPLRIVRAYDDPTPITWSSSIGDRIDRPRTMSEIFTGLIRNNFKVDTLLEPTAPPTGQRSPWFTELMRSVPATLLMRARKQGT